MRLALLLVLAFVGSSGCFGGQDGAPADNGDAGEAALQAPWWTVGESWTIEFEQGGKPARTVKMVNFANDTFGDPEHFWLGVADRDDALDHVFFDNNPFLGRIHWQILAPHEKGMHSAMYVWPLEDGEGWTSPILFGHKDLSVLAARRDDGTYQIEGEAREDGARFAYDYDPATRWFRELSITDEAGAVELRARVVDHADAGERGTYHFLRGRDYLDADGGTTGEEETFMVEEEGATSIAFLLNVRTTSLASIEFVDPAGRTIHRETLPIGGTSDRVVEIKSQPTPGEWKLRYVGSVTGTVLVRGVIEYKATI